MQTTSINARRLFIGTILVLLFLIPALVACGNNSGSGSGNSSHSAATTPTPQSTVTGPATTPTAQVTPGVLLGVQPCPAGVKDPSYWNSFVNAQSGVSMVESVSCANLIGDPSLQALVTLRHSDDGSTLNVYVFNNITSAAPTNIFQVNGLVKGEAKISGYNTVLTAQADELSALNAGKPVSMMTADLYREFKWSDGAGTLVQTVFPGIYPDLTRYQAEDDQAQVNQGQQPWKLSATMVARALAMTFLNWHANSPTTLLSGGGAHDVSALVRVQSGAPGGGSITVTLARLENNTNGGIWEATAVTTAGTSITSPAPLAQFSNPVQVTGTGNAIDGQVGQLIVLDHLYNRLGRANAMGAMGEGPTSFSNSVYYQSTFPAGIQEGVLLLSIPSNTQASIASAVIVKVLVNGANERPFAVLSVDLTVAPASLTGVTCGTTVTFTYTATFHVQAGSAGGTIQFLYTWNNGRASPSGSVSVAPNGPSTVTFTYTATGRVGPAYAFPGVGQVNVTSPGTLQSPQALVTGSCTA